MLRDGALSPIGADLERFLVGAERVGYSLRARTAMASEVEEEVVAGTKVAVKWSRYTVAIVDRNVTHRSPGRPRRASQSMKDS